MNKFILQLSLRNHQLESYVNALKKVNANYSFFSVYNNNNLIDYLPDDFTNNDYIAFAGIKALKLSKDLSVSNFENIEKFHAHKSTYETSFFYEDKNKFDQKYYKDLNLPLLNQNSIIIDLKDNLETTFDRDVFIKPTSDLKGYVGGIVPAGVSINEFLKDCSRMPHWITEPTLVADIKDIHSEYRFFVVGHEVITGSLYMLNKEVDGSVEIPSEVLKAAHRLAPCYTPDRVFTMDLALLTNGDIEIVEYNCFNGSGTYLAPLEDLMKLLMEIKLV